MLATDTPTTLLAVAMTHYELPGLGLDGRNVDHGFLLEPSGWSLAPAYDMNPNHHGAGLRLNISETDNTQDLELAREVAPYFRVKDGRAKEIIDLLVGVVAHWRDVAAAHGISRDEQERMARAFDHARVH